MGKVEPIATYCLEFLKMTYKRLCWKHLQYVHATPPTQDVCFKLFKYCAPWFHNPPNHDIGLNKR
jgi:hypothetical protein